jgi:hypothetical protein
MWAQLDERSDMSALKMTAISVVLAVSYSGLSRAADPPSLGELVEKYRMAAESLADSESRQEAAEALFGRRYDRDPAHFDHLAVHRNGTVALRAVWEECAFHLSLRDVLLDFREESGAFRWGDSSETLRADCERFPLIGGQAHWNIWTSC